MTSSQHGLAVVSENAFEGSMAVQITVHGESMLMSDTEFRDVLRCARDMFPSMFLWQVPEQENQIGAEVHGYDQGVPVRTLSGEKLCGCFITDVCDCGSFTSSRTWGWTR